MNNETINEAYKNLAYAVLMQAIRDAKKGDVFALTWLDTEDAKAYWEPLGISQNTIDRITAYLVELNNWNLFPKTERIQDLQLTKYW